MHRQRAPRDGTGDHPRQIQHPEPGKRAVAGGPWLWPGIADFLDRDQRQFGKRPGVGQRRPFLIRAHQRHDAAAGIGGGLECLAVPLQQRGLNIIALRLAVQDLADGVAVVREIGMQPHKALIAGSVDSGDGIPRRPWWLAIDAQVTLGTAFDDGMLHIDRDILRLPAAQFPYLRGGKSGRGNAGLRRGGNAKRGRQLRLFTRQRDGVECGRIAACQRPQIGKDFARRLHGMIPSGAPRHYHAVCRRHYPADRYIGNRHHPRKRIRCHCEKRSDEAIQSAFVSRWIASRSLSSGGALRRPVGSQ